MSRTVQTTVVKSKGSRKIASVKSHARVNPNKRPSTVKVSESFSDLHEMNKKALKMIGRS